MIEVQQSAELISSQLCPQLFIERIARVCWGSEDRMDGEGDTVERNRLFLKSLIKKGHESPLEHGFATFKIVTDRGITHELVRHRLASYTQQSTRYVKFTDGIPVIRPDGLEGGDLDIWKWSMERAESTYLELLDFGVRAEIARDVLPTCLATTIFMTANFREWRHILKLRLAPDAHPKMRKLMRLIAIELAKLAPVLFEEFIDET